MTFGDALDALEADEVVKKALPGDMYRVFTHYKRDEWERYCADRDRLGRAGIPRRAALGRRTEQEAAMCGIAGIIYRDGSEHDVGFEMTRMLQSMKHRGPDSTGYALYGLPTTDYVMRYKLADANDARDFEFEERLERNRREAEARMAQLGARIEDVEHETEYAFRVTFSYDGDLKRLTDYVEDIPGGEVLSLGHSLEIIKDLGDAETVSDQYELTNVQGDARDRPRPHGDRVGRRHLGRAPVLGLPVLRHRGRPQRPAHELLQVAAAARALRPPVPVGVRLRDHRRLPRAEDGAREVASRRR